MIYRISGLVFGQRKGHKEKRKEYGVVKEVISGDLVIIYLLVMAGFLFVSDLRWKH